MNLILSKKEKRHTRNSRIIQNNQNPPNQLIWFTSMAWEFVCGLHICQTLSDLKLPEYVSISATHTLKRFHAARIVYISARSFLIRGESICGDKGGYVEKLWAHIRQQLPPPSLFSSTFLWVGDGGDGLDGKGASPPCQLTLWAWGQLSAPWQLRASLWPPDPSGFTLSAQINLHIEWCHYFAP